MDKANRICDTLMNRAVAAHQSFDFVETRYTEESPNFHLRASVSKKVAGNTRTPEPCSQELWFRERCEQRRFFPKGKEPPSFLGGRILGVIPGVKRLNSYQEARTNSQLRL